MDGDDEQEEFPVLKEVGLPKGSVREVSHLGHSMFDMEDGWH